ncbi:MAG: 16S rRNA (guanine(527)-N(7))-methyltransferase RsmG [Treponema sp.]
MEEAEISRLLQDGFTVLEIPDSAKRLQNYMLQYIHELEIFNAAFNLIKVENARDLVIRHIFDSLAPWKIFAEKIDAHTGAVPFRFADIGSGAGLPGIPLACLFLLRNPEVEFSLIERMHKRCSVLENVRAVLGLQNVYILQTEAEKAPRDYFDLAVFRAFRPLDRIMVNTLRAGICSEGMLAAYKGKKTAIEEEMNAIDSEVSSYSIIPLNVPFSTAERNLVCFGKAKASCV